MDRQAVTSLGLMLAFIAAFIILSEWSPWANAQRKGKDGKRAQAAAEND